MSSLVSEYECCKLKFFQWLELELEFFEGLQKLLRKIWNRTQNLAVSMSDTKTLISYCGHLHTTRNKFSKNPTLFLRFGPPESTLIRINCRTTTELFEHALQSG